MSLDKLLKSTVRVLETVKHCSTGTYYLLKGDHDVARHAPSVSPPPSLSLLSLSLVGHASSQPPPHMLT